MGHPDEHVRRKLLCEKAAALYDFSSAVHALASLAKA